MKEIFISGILMALSLWEMWICYSYLQSVLPEEKGCRIRKWCSIIFVGGLLGVNRLITFFSRTMFLFALILTILFVCLRKEQKVLRTGVVITYFSCVAIIDMVGALFLFDFLLEDFWSVVYAYATSWEKIFIYLLTRIIIYAGTIVLKGKEKDIQLVAEQCKYSVLGTGIVLGILLLRYQHVLDGLAEGKGNIEGINASVILLFVASVVAVGSILIFKYRYVVREKEVLLMREKLLEQRYSEIVKSRQIVHDMENHLLLLQQYEREKRWDELHHYLNEISKEWVSETMYVRSGNATLDLILNSKKAYADAHGIEVRIESNTAGNLPLSNREIISLFGNLLDNAIEACERIQTNNKWIHINIHKHNQLSCIEIENSIEEQPEIKKGRLVSKKYDKSMHGYGLKNVKQIVDRHEGTYSYKINENSFSTMVTFFDSEDVI